MEPRRGEWYFQWEDPPSLLEIHPSLLFNAWEMNPPDLNVPVGRTDYEKEQVDQVGDGQNSSTPEDDEAIVEEEEDFASLLQPTRWWMTSTAFPLLAVHLPLTPLVSPPIANTIDSGNLRTYGKRV